MIGRYDSITVSTADINFLTDRYLYLYEDVGSFSLCIESVAEVELRAFILDYYHNNYRGAKDGKDFDFPNHSFTAEQPFHNFTVYPRETRCFEISIIDDNIAERDEPLYFYLGIYDPRPNICDYWSAHIVDNDGKSCKCICTQSTFTARGTAEQKRSEAEECITVYRTSLVLDGLGNLLVCVPVTPSDNSPEYIIKVGVQKTSKRCSDSEH